MCEESCGGSWLDAQETIKKITAQIKREEQEVKHNLEVDTAWERYRLTLMHFKYWWVPFKNWFIVDPTNTKAVQWNVVTNHKLYSGPYACHEHWQLRKVLLAARNAVDNKVYVTMECQRKFN